MFAMLPHTRMPLSKKLAATASIGLLMLDTRFPRPPGDVGNPASHDFPLLIEIVEGASPQRVVIEGAQGLLEPFVAAGLKLIERGAIGITTSCGFLTPFQQALAARLPVPVAVSSLLQLSLIEACLPTGRRCGVLTIDEGSLTPAHFLSVGARPDTPVRGMPDGGSFQRTILGNLTSLDAEACRDELVEAGRALVARSPEVAAIVLECTNLPPYRAALQAALRLPVYDINTLLDWFWNGLTSRAY